VIRSFLAAHDGSEMDTRGNAFFAVFSSPRGCVAAVLGMRQVFEAHAWPGGVRVRVRMGVHCGEAARTAADLVGPEVHQAARVAAVAHGGQVLVSETAAALVRDWLPPGAALADLGRHRLKDLGRRPPVLTGCAPAPQRAGRHGGNQLCAGRSSGVNVAAQLLGTRGDRGYALTDIGINYADAVVARLKEMGETVRPRVLS
jgi:class 3 adenylate cyclase